MKKWFKDKLFNHRTPLFVKRNEPHNKRIDDKHNFCMDVARKQTDREAQDGFFPHEKSISSQELENVQIVREIHSPRFFKSA
jgi:hypothetical protein